MKGDGWRVDLLSTGAELGMADCELKPPEVIHRILNDGNLLHNRNPNRRSDGKRNNIIISISIKTPTSRCSRCIYASKYYINLSIVNCTKLFTSDKPNLQFSNPFSYSYCILHISKIFLNKLHFSVGRRSRLIILLRNT